MNDVVISKTVPVQSGQSTIDSRLSTPTTGYTLENNPFFENKPPKKSGPWKEPTEKRFGWGLIGWISIFIFIFLLSGIFFAGNHFSSAMVKVTPITQTKTIDTTFTALKEGVQGDLLFQQMSLTETKTKEATSTIEKKIKEKASGKIIIFNSYSVKEQRIIKNTRFESKEQKIFQIGESVVVPGAKMKAGKVMEPGSVEAIIYADVPSKDYNIGYGDFTIPGFKGTAKYTKFTARSKDNSPVSGGMFATVKIPSDTDRKSIEDELRQDLKKNLISKARSQIPTGRSFFPGSMVLTFYDIPNDINSKNPAIISVRGTISVFLFDTVALTQKLSEVLLGDDHKGNLFSIPDISKINFVFVDPIDSSTFNDSTKIKFKITGPLTLIGEIDTQKIRTALAGKDKEDFNKIIAEEGPIKESDAVISPRWSKKFPTDPAKILIKIVD